MANAHNLQYGFCCLILELFDLMTQALHFIITNIINQIIKMSSIRNSGIFYQRTVYNTSLHLADSYGWSGFHGGLTRFSWAVHTYKGLFPSLISSGVIGSCLLVTYRSNLEKQVIPVRSRGAFVESWALYCARGHYWDRNSAITAIKGEL